MGAKASKAPNGPVVFDSDVLIGHIRGFPEAQHLIELVRFSQRLVPAVSVMEVLCGARDRTDMRRIQRWIDGTFSKVVHVSEEMSRRALSLVARHALPSRMEVTDALIAAMALTANATLATGNLSDFRVVAGLRLLPYRRQG